MKTQDVNTILWGPVLFIVLLIIKLLNPSSLPWVWVFAPIWIPLSLAALVLIGIGIYRVMR